MMQWMLGIKICLFGLGAVFLCLGVLIGFIYLFGIVLKSIDKNSVKKAG